MRNTLLDAVYKYRLNEIVREHHMQRDAQLLGEVDVPKAGWVGDNGVGNERLASSR